MFDVHAYYLNKLFTWINYTHVCAPDSEVSVEEVEDVEKLVAYLTAQQAALDAETEVRQHRHLVNNLVVSLDDKDT